MRKNGKTTRDDGALRRLAERIRVIENRSVGCGGGDGGGGSNPRLPPGAIGAGDGSEGLLDWWGGDRAFGTELAPGAIHEWFEVADSTRLWTPPLCLLAHLARQASARAEAADGANGVVWLGRRVWPYMWVLRHQGHFRGGQVFADPADVAGRIWAIDLALRSGAVAAVVADGSGLDMAATRRLQLAAEAGGAMGLLARPPNELGQLSAAATRWLVRASPSRTTSPMWEVQLLRWKGELARSHALTGGSIMVEWNGATGTVVIPADMVSRSGKEQTPARKQRRTA